MRESATTFSSLVRQARQKNLPTDTSEERNLTYPPKFLIFMTKSFTLTLYYEIFHVEKLYNNALNTSSVNFNILFNLP